MSSPLLRITGSDGPGGPRSLALRGLIVFALGLAVAGVVRAIFMVWVYGCIGLIALSLGIWRAIRGGNDRVVRPDRAGHGARVTAVVVPGPQPSYCGP